MRLIDADALIETMEFHVTTMSVCSTTIEARAKGEMKRTCIADVANAPTVPAIPVGCLKDKMQRPQMTDGNPFGFVLAEWLEEQEAR